MSGGVEVLCRVGDTELRIVSLNLAGADQASVTVSFPFAPQGRLQRSRALGLSYCSGGA
jgi:hypothetical protein